MKPCLPNQSEEPTLKVLIGSTSCFLCSNIFCLSFIIWVPELFNITNQVDISKKKLTVRVPTVEGPIFIFRYISTRSPVTEKVCFDVFRAV